MPAEVVLSMMVQLGIAIAGFNGVATALSPEEPRRRRREVNRWVVRAAGEPPRALGDLSNHFAKAGANIG